MTRSNLMKSLKKRFPNMFLRTSEEFYGNTKKCNVGGIWTSGEDDLKDEKGNVLFDYYEEFGGDRVFDFGVYKPFSEWLEKRGWYCEWYDAGTILMWPL